MTRAACRSPQLCPLSCFSQGKAAKGDNKNVKRDNKNYCHAAPSSVLAPTRNLQLLREVDARLVRPARDVTAGRRPCGTVHSPRLLFLELMNIIIAPTPITQGIIPVFLTTQRPCFTTTWAICRYTAPGSALVGLGTSKEPPTPITDYAGLFLLFKGPGPYRQMGDLHVSSPRESALVGPQCR